MREGIEVDVSDILLQRKVPIGEPIAGNIAVSVHAKGGVIGELMELTSLEASAEEKDPQEKKLDELEKADLDDADNGKKDVGTQRENKIVLEV